MNFHSYGESPSKSVRIITGQSVLIDPSSRPKGTCLEVESGIARVYCPCEETEGMTPVSYTHLTLPTICSV